jgi:hypothetical protein
MANLKRRLERLEKAQLRKSATVIVVKEGETKEEAWQRHLAQHPEDEKAEPLIYLILNGEPPAPAD